MTESPLKLVPPPSADEKVRKDIIDNLCRLIEKAERGELKSLIALCEYSGSGWANFFSGNTSFSNTVGYLEIVKQEMIASYLKEQGK